MGSVEEVEEGVPEVEGAGAVAEVAAVRLADPPELEALGDSRAEGEGKEESVIVATPVMVGVA